MSEPCITLVFWLLSPVQEVRLHEVNPPRSYLPAWISNSLVRSRLPSAAGGGAAESELLRTPNLANTIHGSLHGGKVLPACSHFHSLFMRILLRSAVYGCTSMPLCWHSGSAGLA